MEILKEGGDVQGGIPAPNPVLQDGSGGRLDSLNMAAAPNGLLELSGIAAFQNKLDIRRMGFQDAPQKGLGLGRQIIGPLQPQHGPFSPPPPDMEFLTPLPESPILPTRTGQKLLLLRLCVFLNPVALPRTGGAGNNEGRLIRGH